MSGGAPSPMAVRDANLIRFEHNQQKIELFADMLVKFLRDEPHATSAQLVVFEAMTAREIGLEWMAP